MVRLAFLFTTTSPFFVVVVLIWYLKREFLSQVFCMLFIGTYPRIAFRDEYLSIMLITKLFSLKNKICSYNCWWKRMWVRAEPVKWTSSPREIYWGNRTSFWVCLPMQAAREFEDYLDLCDNCLILVQKEGKNKMFRQRWWSCLHPAAAAGHNAYPPKENSRYTIIEHLNIAARIQN